MRDMWVLHVSSKLGKQLANPGPVWTMVRPKASLGSTLRPETSLGNGHFIGLGIGMTHSKDWDSPSARRLRDVYAGLCPLCQLSRGSFLQRPPARAASPHRAGHHLRGLFPRRRVAHAPAGLGGPPRPSAKIILSVGLRSRDLHGPSRHMQLCGPTNITPRGFDPAISFYGTGPSTTTTKLRLLLVNLSISLISFADATTKTAVPRLFVWPAASHPLRGLRAALS